MPIEATSNPGIRLAMLKPTSPNSLRKTRHILSHPGCQPIFQRSTVSPSAWLQPSAERSPPGAGAPPPGRALCFGLEMRPQLGFLFSG